MKRFFLFLFFLSFLGINEVIIFAKNDESINPSEIEKYRKSYKRQDGRVGDYYATSEEMNAKILPNTPRGNTKKVLKNDAERLDNFEIMSPEQGVNPYYKLMLRQRVMAPTMKVEDPKPKPVVIEQKTEAKDDKNNAMPLKKIPSKKKSNTVFYVSGQGIYFLAQDMDMLGFEKRTGDLTVYASEIYKMNYHYNSSYGLSYSVGMRNISHFITRKELELGMLQLKGKNGTVDVNETNNPPGTSFYPVNNLGNMDLGFFFFNLMKDFYVNRLIDFSFGGGIGVAYANFNNNFVKSGYFSPVNNLTAELKIKLSNNLDFFTSYRIMYVEGDFFDNNYNIDATDTGGKLTYDRSLQINGTRVERSFFNMFRIGIRYYFD